MKVLMTLGLFYPSKLGGPANTLYWLAKSLVSNNIRVSVVTSNNHIDDGLVKFDEWTEIDNIKVRYCTVNSKLSLRVIFHSIKELFRVCWIIDICAEYQQINRYIICITARNWVFLLHKPCILWYDTRAPDSFQFQSSRCPLRQNWMRITGGLYFQK